ncbi:HesA/MoeB/ThiF family protein [Phosphitispora sp. TUW77]|uniref:HesA/MoeB/ThiF family protein n=1 Tax=Phosphitispora sp. TUW77 TaxID=3152361 RepID=UPI003AB245BE
MGLSEKEKNRYHRQLIIKEIGEAGQLMLKAGKVLVAGTGGLGSPVLFYLTAAGIGTIGFIDCDSVDLSNLQRQILHGTDDLEKPKVISAFKKLSALNPVIKLVPINKRVDRDNAADLISGYDVVVDCTDNFSTRYILNEACIKSGKPFVYGGILDLIGQVMTIVPGKGPCFQCVFREPPSSVTLPNKSGVLGVVAGTIGSIQAAEAIKLLIGKGKLLTGRLLMYNALEATFREVEVKPDPDCPVCGKN